MLKKVFGKKKNRIDVIIVLIIALSITWVIGWLLAMVLETIFPSLQSVAFDNWLFGMDISMSVIASFLVLTVFTGKGSVDAMRKK